MNNSMTINVALLLPEKFHNATSDVTKAWNKYFNINTHIDTPGRLKTFIGKKIDLLFLWHENLNNFELRHYEKFKNSSKHFKYVILKPEMNPAEDIEIYKRLVDDIVYLNEPNFYKWKSIAILRRFWENSSKDTTIIYKDIIADFIDDSYLVGNQKVELTGKESKLLRLFMKNVGKYIPKEKIFKDIWGFENDTSRALEQMMFKLKKKIGKEYFTSSRTEGIKFE